MADKQRAGLLMTRNPFRIIACLVFLLLLNPIPELLHADDCELEACHFCHTSADNHAVFAAPITAMLQPTSIGTSIANPVALPTGSFATVRSRGPPLT
ncbi:MAG: hypothetical protein AB8B81_09305 [Halioglobus sp.]